MFRSRMPPFRHLCCFLLSSLIGRKGGNGSGFARAIKGFPFFGSFRAKKRLAAKAQCPYLLSLFPCKGGQVVAFGSFFISLVSFVVIASFMFQARKLCFRFVVVAPAFQSGGLYFGLTPNRPTFGLRATPFGRNIFARIYETGKNAPQRE